MLLEQKQPLLDGEPALWHPLRGALPEQPAREGYFASSATPGILNHPAIKESQLAVRRQVELAFSSEFLPPFVDEQLAEFVWMVYESREANRSSKNGDSYSLPYHDLADVDPELKSKLEKAEVGAAEPSEILELIDELGMGSAELARLTHIFGYRADEYQEDMRQRVTDAILGRGGEVYTTPKTKYGIIALDTAITEREHLSIGLAMKRKKLIGRIGGTDIYERTTFILRIDKASPIDQDVGHYLRSLPSDNPPEVIERITQDGRLKQEVIRLLQEDNFEALIPMSTTIFACNNENLARLETEKNEKRSELTLRSEAQLPELLAERERQRLASVAITATRAWPPDAR